MRPGHRGLRNAECGLKGSARRDEPFRSVRPSEFSASLRPFARRGVTLPEMIVVVGLISALAVVVSLTTRTFRDGSITSLAQNTLNGYLRVARAYAIANQIETMLVVNPYDGRLELWRANPPRGQQRNPPWYLGNPFFGGWIDHPDDVDGNSDNFFQWPDGGEWDIQSSGSVNAGALLPLRSLANGYIQVSLLDSAARLPVDAKGVPLVLVSPLDFAFRQGLTDSDNKRFAIDNLIWTAFCFDADGRMVSRVRRIDLNERGIPFAEQEYQPTPRRPVPVGGPNSSGYSVDADEFNDRYDTPLYTTVGYIVSERKRFEADWANYSTYGNYAGFLEPPQNEENYSANYIVNWLTNSLPREEKRPFAQPTLLSQWSGRPVQPANRPVD